jgi:hypothetical protein
MRAAGDGPLRGASTARRAKAQVMKKAMTAEGIRCGTTTTTTDASRPSIIEPQFDPVLRVVAGPQHP